MNNEYAVQVLNDETYKHERKYVGNWVSCIKFAHNIIAKQFPFSEGKPEGLRIQGSETEPGYVGYAYPDSNFGKLQIVIDDANPQPPAAPPFDYDAAIRESAQLMFSELQKSENADLVVAVKSVGNHNGVGGNFMFGFTWRNPQGEYVKDDECRASIIEHNEQAPLNESQTLRWDAIVAIGDKHGHSGASYGFACRELQRMLNE